MFRVYLCQKWLRLSLEVDECKPLPAAPRCSTAAPAERSPWV